jgi:hypothetical protein
MQNLTVTHGFMRKLTKNIRNSYGIDVPHTKVLELVAEALGHQAGPLMNALKKASQEDPIVACEAPTQTRRVGRYNPPALSELGVMSDSDLQVMRSIGLQKCGLVLVTGLNGSGKTVFTTSLVKEWVINSGKTAFTTGELIEYPELGGRHGAGMIIQSQNNRDQPLRDCASTMLAYDPAYFLVNDHIVPSRRHDAVGGEDFPAAIEMASDRLVVISGYGSSEQFLNAISNNMSESTGEHIGHVSRRIEQALTAVVDVTRSKVQDGPACFTAKLRG